MKTDKELKAGIEALDRMGEHIYAADRTVDNVITLSAMAGRAAALEWALELNTKGAAAVADAIRAGEALPPDRN